MNKSRNPSRAPGPDIEQAKLSSTRTDGGRVTLYLFIVGLDEVLEVLLGNRASEDA
jgi:hypothetical protein